MICKICKNETNNFKDKYNEVTYSHCRVCGFISKDERHLVDSKRENEEYNRHNNNIEDHGYTKRFYELINDYIRPNTKEIDVLEFGSGPSPVFYEILLLEGYKAEHYDPYYYKNDSVFKKKYSIITSVEVVEHFYDPLFEFSRLKTLLKEGGYLVIMTNFRTMSIEAFNDWWYKRDITHVSFYNEDTMKYLSDHLGFKIVQTNHKNIIVFQK